MEDIDEQLDLALEMTFPASDPVSIGKPERSEPSRKSRPAAVIAPENERDESVQ